MLDDQDKDPVNEGNDEGGDAKAVGAEHLDADTGNDEQPGGLAQLLNNLNLNAEQLYQLRQLASMFGGSRVSDSSIPQVKLDLQTPQFSGKEDAWINWKQRLMGYINIKGISRQDMGDLVAKYRSDGSVPLSTR